MKELLKRLLFLAIKKVYDEDKELLTNKVSERCVCARLAFYLENAIREFPYAQTFKGYYVDVEYDRMEDGMDKSIGKGEKRHVCDLLIHSRGGATLDNLLALEMKVHDNYHVKDDIQRLHDLVQPNNENNEGTVHNTLLGVLLRMQEKQYKYSLFDAEVDGGNRQKEHSITI